MRLNAIMAVVTVSCVVAVVAGPRIGPLNIRGHHVGRGGAASSNHWRAIGMEYLDDEGAPLAVTLASALGRPGGRLLARYSQHDDPGPGDPINPLNGMGQAQTGQSRFALANSSTSPGKSAAAPAQPPAPLSPPANPPAPSNAGGIQPFVTPTDPPKPPTPPPGPPDPTGPGPQGPPVIDPSPPISPPPVIVTLVTPTPPVAPAPPSAPPALPEPGTWALMLLGFGAVGAALRRRRGMRLNLGARAA